MTDKRIPNERRQYEYKSVYPEKSIVIDGVDVSGCELYRNDNGVFAPDGTAERTELCYLTNDYCYNNPNCYYKQLKRSEAQCEGMFITHTDLEKKYKAKEQECEELKDLANHNGRVCNERLDKIDELEHNINELNGQLDQLEEENRSLKKQLQFEFDETLLQYSNTIEDLQKQLNNTVMQKCPQCGEVYLNPVGCELHEENQQLKAENKTQKETIDGFLSILDKLGKSNIKLRETLTEIKDIVKQGVKIHDDIIVSKKILQIIDEVEND